MNMFFDTSGYSANRPAGSTSAAGQISRLETQVRELTNRVDRMALACQALWELAEERLDMSDKLLRDKMTEIDLRDGQRDGKIAMSVLVCPHCGNRSNSRRQQCIFCGGSVPSKHTFG